MANLVFPRFQLIDPGGFIEKLAANLDRSEGQVGLFDFHPTTPRRNPFWYALEDRRIGTRGRYSLIQTPSDYAVQEIDLVTGVCGLDPEEQIGYLTVEEGTLNVGEAERGIYEKMCFRLNSSLSLRDRRTVSRCMVELLVEAQEAPRPYVGRVDSLRTSCFGWKSADLESILPTDWFVTEAVNASLAQQAGYTPASS